MPRGRESLLPGGLLGRDSQLRTINIEAVEGPATGPDDIRAEGTRKGSREILLNGQSRFQEKPVSLESLTWAINCGPVPTTSRPPRRRQACRKAGGRCGGSSPRHGRGL